MVVLPVSSLLPLSTLCPFLFHPLNMSSALYISVRLDSLRTCRRSFVPPLSFAPFPYASPPHTQPTTPPTNPPPNPPRSSHLPRCTTTRVLTVPCTSTHRGISCDPLGARALSPSAQEGCSGIALSGYLAGSVLAWRPSGAQMIRRPSIVKPGIRPSRWRVDPPRGDREIRASRARCANCAFCAAKSSSILFFFSSCPVLNASCCGWLVLMRKRIDCIEPRWREFALLFYFALSPTRLTGKSDKQYYLLQVRLLHHCELHCWS